MASSALLLHLLSRAHPLVWRYNGDFPEVVDFSIAPKQGSLQPNYLYLGTNTVKYSHGESGESQQGLPLLATAPGSGALPLAYLLSAGNSNGNNNDNNNDASNGGGNNGDNCGNSTSNSDAANNTGGGKSASFAALEIACYRAFWQSTSYKLRLREHAWSDSDYTGLVEVGFELLDRPFFLASKDYEIIAQSPQAENIIPHKYAANGLDTLEDFMAVVTKQDDFFGVASHHQPFIYQQRYLCRNIFREGRYEARLITLLKDDLTPGLTAAFELVAQSIELLHAKISLGSYRRRQKDEMHQLLRRLPVLLPQEAADAAAASLWHNRCPYRVVILELQEFSKRSDHTDFVLFLLENSAAGSAAVSLADGRIGWFVPLTGRENEQAFLDDIILYAYVTLSPTETPLRDSAGVSALHKAAATLQAALLEAESAFSLSNSSYGGKAITIRYFSDYVVEHAINHACGPLPVESLLHPAIRRLRDWDASHDSDYLRTLAAFIENGFSQTDTAHALYIHRSTLVRHLQAIQHISGLEDFAQDLLHVLLSLRLASG